MPKDRTARHRMSRYRARQAGERGLHRVEFQVPSEQVPAVRALVREWLATHEAAMPKPRVSASTVPNPEAVNDLAKLMLHRRIAGKLKRNPGLIEAARRVVAGWSADAGRQPRDWQALLRQPADEIARVLTAPGDRSRRLRNSSPFPALDGLAVTDPNARKRLWRSAKRMLARQKTT